jgi:hypothetical protein
MAADASSSSEQSLGETLGLRGPAIVWGRVLAFFLAWMLCGIPSVLFFMLRGGSRVSPSYWALEFFTSLLFVALVVISFRNIRGDVGAVVVASIAYTLLVPWLQLLNRPVSGLGSLAVPSVAALNLGPLFVLLGLALSLRGLRPRWLALWVGSLAGFVVSYLFSILLAASYLARTRPAFAHLSLSAENLAADIVTATAFTLIFELLSSVLD